MENVETPRSKSADGSKYVKGREALLNLVRAGQPGDCLPAERILCQRIQVSRSTLRRAIEHLIQDDVLEARQGSGTFIKRDSSAEDEDRSEREKGASRSSLIALLVPSVEYSMISSIAKGVEARATELGYLTLLLHDNRNPLVQIEQLRRVVKMSEPVAGIVIYPDSANFLNAEFLSLVKEARSRGLGVVFVDRYAAIPGASCVLSDNFTSMYRAAEHLIMLGRRRLGFLTFSEEGGVSYHDRRKGFYQALQDYRVKPEWVVEEVVPPGKYEETSEEIVGRWIAEGKFSSLEGIVCMLGNMAYGAYVALRKHGLSVPGNVALVGYDDFDFRGFPGVDLDLTYIEQPGEKIGAESVNLLFRSLQENQTTKGQHVLIETNLVVGSSSTAKADGAVLSALS